MVIIIYMSIGELTITNAIPFIIITVVGKVIAELVDYFLGARAKALGKNVLWRQAFFFRGDYVYIRLDKLRGEEEEVNHVEEINDVIHVEGIKNVIQVQPPEADGPPPPAYVDPNFFNSQNSEEPPAYEPPCPPAYEKNITFV